MYGVFRRCSSLTRQIACWIWVSKGELLAIVCMYGVTPTTNTTIFYRNHQGHRPHHDVPERARAEAVGIHRNRHPTPDPSLLRHHLRGATPLTYIHSLYTYTHTYTYLHTYIHTYIHAYIYNRTTTLIDPHPIKYTYITKCIHIHTYCAMFPGNPADRIDHSAKGIQVHRHCRGRRRRPDARTCN